MNQLIQSDARTSHRRSMPWLPPPHDSSFSFEPVRNQKAAYVCALKFLDKNTTQPNLGRIQQKTAEDYEGRPAGDDVRVYFAFNAVPGYVRPESLPQSSRPQAGSELAWFAKKMKHWSQSDLMKIRQLVAEFRTDVVEATQSDIVLEHFDGFVDEIDGDTAFVTLKSKSGETLLGEYPARELLAAGIHERRRFLCQTVEVNDRVEVRLEAIPDAPIPDQEIAGLERRLDALVAGGELDGDY